MVLGFPIPKNYSVNEQLLPMIDHFIHKDVFAGLDKAVGVIDGCDEKRGQAPYHGKPVVNPLAGSEGVNRFGWPLFGDQLGCAA